MALPMPLLPPVTMATLPLRVMWLLLALGIGRDGQVDRAGRGCKAAGSARDRVMTKATPPMNTASKRGDTEQVGEVDAGRLERSVALTTSLRDDESSARSLLLLVRRHWPKG